MSSNSTLKNVNFQGADLGRAGSEGTLCGPGAIELPGCLSGDGCASWGESHTNGNGDESTTSLRWQRPFPSLSVGDENAHPKMAAPVPALSLQVTKTPPL